MNNNSLILLGKRVRELRVKQELTQEKLSEICKISSRHISEIERGESNPSYQVLEQLADALDISVVEFFNFKHQKNEDELRKEMTRMIEGLTGERLRLTYRVMKDLAE